MKTIIAMVLLGLCMAGCTRQPSNQVQAAQVTAAAPKVWEYKMFNPMYLRNQPGAVEQKSYYLNGGVIVNVEHLANRMAELGWELLDSKPDGEISFRREKGQGKETEVRLVGKSRNE